LQQQEEQLQHPCLPPSLTQLQLRGEALEPGWLPHVCRCSNLQALALTGLDDMTQGIDQPQPAAIVHGVLPRLPQIRWLELNWGSDAFRWTVDPSPYLDAPALDDPPWGVFPTAAWAAAPHLQAVVCSSSKQGEPLLLVPSEWHWRQLAACPGLQQLAGPVQCWQPPPEGVVLAHLQHFEARVAVPDTLQLQRLLQALPALQRLVLTLDVADGAVSVCGVSHGWGLEGVMSPALLSTHCRLVLGPTLQKAQLKRIAQQGSYRYAYHQHRRASSTTMCPGDSNSWA
jgi:hypothetical protein